MTDVFDQYTIEKLREAVALCMQMGYSADFTAHVLPDISKEEVQQMYEEFRQFGIRKLSKKES